MSSYVIGFQDLDKTKLMLAGGKGANLGELTRIPGIRVPEGFCITTEAFKRIIGEMPSIRELLEQLSQLAADDRRRVSELSGEIRRLIENTIIPQDITNEITGILSVLGEKNAYAVRSSATAEDLPTASFAGQQDTYLNIIGTKEILTHISRCLASLFTERAVTYRQQNGFDHRKVYLSVVVQKMVFPEASGIMFTADPVTSNRKVISVDAGFGLGEAMVSGLVNADNYKVQNGKLIHRRISGKKLAVYALEKGGTIEKELEPEKQNRQVLTDKQVLQLEEIGRKLEEHFRLPQDIEWCLAGDTFYIIQSRPITTLYPVPEPNDGENHVYVSVGHQQMMTDPMKPLGMSIFRLTSFGHRYQAGGRLFVDVTDSLVSPSTRKAIMNTLGQSDPLIKDALMNIIKRKDFINALPDDMDEPGSGHSYKGTPPSKPQIENNPAIVSDLIKSSQAYIEELKHNIQSKSGPALFDFILEDINQLKNFMFGSQSMDVIMAAFNAASWINENMK